MSLETFAAVIVDDVASLVFARSPFGSGHDAAAVVPGPAELPLITVHPCEDALALRPEIRAYDLNVEAQHKSALSGTLRWLPTLSAFGRFTAGNYIGFSGKEWAFATGLQADWQIYDGGLRYGLAHERARLEREGVIVRTVEVGELAKAEGAVTCCSLVFESSTAR